MIPGRAPLHEIFGTMKPTDFFAHVWRFTVFVGQRCKHLIARNELGFTSRVYRRSAIGIVHRGVSTAADAASAERRRCHWRTPRAAYPLFSGDSLTTAEKTSSFHDRRWMSRRLRCKRNHRRVTGHTFPARSSVSWLDMLGAGPRNQTNTPRSTPCCIYVDSALIRAADIDRMYAPQRNDFRISSVSCRIQFLIFFLSGVLRKSLMTKM